MFTCSEFNTIINLKYYSIGNFFSDVGGCFSVYLFAIQYIYKLITMFSFRAYLINSIFRYHSYEENDKIKNDFDNLKKKKHYQKDQI